MVNIKPSRFGPLSELFAAYDYCEDEGHRRLRRRAVGARPGPRPHPVPRLDLPPRHAERRRPVRLQQPGAAPSRGCPTSPLDPQPTETGFRWSLIRRTRISVGPNPHVGRPFAGRVGCPAWPTRTSQTHSTSRSRTSSPPPSSTSATAVYYDSETLPRLAAFFYRQAVEERNHAMIMVQYLLDAGEEVRIPGHQVPADDLRRRRRPGEDGAGAGEAGHRRDRRAVQARPRQAATTRASSS